MVVTSNRAGSFATSLPLVLTSGPEGATVERRASERKSNEEVDRRAKEEADRKAKQQSDEKASEEAQRKSKEILRNTHNEVPSPLARGLKPFLGMTLAERDGALVVSGVFVLGPAHRCGIMLEDVVVSVAAIAVTSFADVRQVLELKCVSAGHLVSVVVLQHQRTTQRHVVLRVMTTDASVTDSAPDLFYTLEGHTKLTAGASAATPPIGPFESVMGTSVGHTEHPSSRPICVTSN